MEDKSIIQLYWDRNDQAIKATVDKYGHYCKSIARNILNSEEDAEECVKRHFNRYKNNHAQKRGSGEIALVLEELTDCISGVDNVEQSVDRQELIKDINSFVRSLPTEKRNLFVRRYWYADSVSFLAKEYGMLPGTVSKTLERTRKQLKTYLTERGFEI